MEGKNIPIIIMLIAGTAVSIACLVYNFPLLETLIAVLLTMLGFYFIGLIIKKIIYSINRSAEERARLLESQKEKKTDDGNTTEGVSTEETKDSEDSIVKKEEASEE